jgi:transcriptional regulator with XRE-family HTH domain
MTDYVQLQRARILLNMALSEAAAAVGQARSAVTLFETGQFDDPDLAGKLRQLYESHGIEFGENGQIGFRPGFSKAIGSSQYH